MYLNNPDQKIRITNRWRNFMVNERTKHNYTGSVVAKKMGRQQSWIAQVESGRIQSIKHQDLVMFFSVILDISPEEADQYLSTNFVNNNEEDADIELSYSELFKLIDKCISDYSNISEADISQDLKHNVQSQLKNTLSDYKEELHKLVDKITIEKTQPN